MGDNGYPATIHSITRSLGRIEYPVTREELLAQVGGEPVGLDWGVTAAMGEILERLPDERFETAASLFCHIAAVL